MLGLELVHSSHDAERRENQTYHRKSPTLYVVLYIQFVLVYFCTLVPYGKIVCFQQQTQSEVLEHSTYRAPVWKRMSL